MPKVISTAAYSVYQSGWCLWCFFKQKAQEEEGGEWRFLCRREGEGERKSVYRTHNIFQVIPHLRHLQITCSNSACPVVPWTSAHSLATQPSSNPAKSFGSNKESIIVGSIGKLVPLSIIVSAIIVSILSIEIKKSVLVLDQCSAIVMVCLTDNFCTGHRIQIFTSRQVHWNRKGPHSMALRPMGLTTEG